MNYTRRLGTDDSGREYEVRITALLALRCVLMKDTKEIWLGSNVDHVGDFDDIVLLRESLDNTRIAYLIQLKHQENPKNITRHEFLYNANLKRHNKSKENYSLSKYFRSYLQLTEQITKIGENELNIIKQLQQTNKIVLILFTNKGATDCDFLETICDKELFFLNTYCNNRENIYKFNLDTYDKHFVDQFILFLNQIHINKTDNLIQNEIKQIICLSNQDLKTVCDEYLTFIRNWMNNATKNHYALTKQDVINNLSYILLHNYIYDFRKDPFAFYTCPQKLLWNEFVRDKKITVIEESQLIKNFLKEFIGSIVKQYSNKMTRTWDAPIPKTAHQLCNKTIGNCSIISFFDVYKCLWFNKEIPLLLCSNNDCDFLNICKILTFTNNQIIILQSFTNLSLPKTKNISFFNLHNLNENIDKILNLKVQVQGRLSIPLQEVIDKSMYKHIKCAEIIKILSNDFSIGGKSNSLPDYFIQTQLFNTKSKQIINAEQVWNEFDCNQILPLVISAAPGMGKSTFIDYIAKQTPANIWVVKVDLNNHDDYYENRKCKFAKINDHLRYFADCKSDLCKATFQKLINEKRVLILLDGFDEIFVSYKDTVIKIIKSLCKDNFRVCVTTRPFTKSYLEEEFNVSAITLKPFTTDNQKQFLIRYFAKVVEGNQTLVTDFIQSLLKAAKENLFDKDSEFMGVPLQMKLLADVFTHNLLQSVKEGIVKLRQKFDLLYLYDEFVRNKSIIVCDKFGKGAKQMRILFEKHQQLFALKTLFDKDTLKELNINSELDEYYREEHKLQFLQRDGVLTITDKKNVTFVHRTFAEYLAAQWLSENFSQNKTALVILKMRFPPNRLYPFLFNMFDRILVNECPLHAAILDDHIDNIKEYMSTDYLNMLDLGGRSVLHIIALCGAYHPYRMYSNKFRTEDKMVGVIEQLPDDFEMMQVQDDLLNLNALDYAIKNYSLAVANKLCNKYTKLTITFQIDSSDYNQLLCYCTWLDYIMLLKMLVPYMVCRNIILPFVCRNMENIELFEECLQNVETNQTVRNVLMELQTDFTNVFYAAAFGTPENVTRLLIQTQINDVDFQGNTALHYAAVLNRLKTVQLLLHNGANVHQGGKGLNTPLHYAAESGANEVILELIASGADINQQNGNDDTALHHAFIGNHIDTIKLLLSKDADYNATNCMGNTILHMAAETGNNEIINELIKNGVDVNILNECDEMPLQSALAENNIDTVRLLLKNKANINGGSLKESPLHYAIITKNIEIVDEILSLGAEINWQNFNGDPPLHYSIMRGNVPLTKHLLAKGAALNIINKKGNSALHYAAASGKDEIVSELLLESDINVLNKDGNPPLHFALENDHSSTSTLLLNKGATIIASNTTGNSTLHYAINFGDHEIVSMILAQGADINKANNDGNKPLHCAAKQGCVSIVTHFLKNNSINTQNKYGQTALHVSIIDRVYYKTEQYDSQIAMIQLLLDHGADIQIKDVKGNTCFHYACINWIKFNETIVPQQVKIECMKFYEEVVHLLIKNGAKANVKNKEGKTPFDLATEDDLFEIILLLEQNHFS